MGVSTYYDIPQLFPPPSLSLSLLTARQFFSIGERGEREGERGQGCPRASMIDAHHERRRFLRRDQQRTLQPPQRYGEQTLSFFPFGFRPVICQLTWWRV
jgi:hypothetical protein